MKARTIVCALMSVSLTLLGCGQKPPSESWSERPHASAAGNPENSATAAGRYDLARDEERGGHTLRKHIARTDDQLRERLVHERDISAASTWTDRDTAEETVAQALRTERGKIENWRQRGDRRPNLALHFDAGHTIGRSIRRGSDQAAPCTQAVIVLRAGGDGFYVLITYPEERE